MKKDNRFWIWGYVLDQVPGKVQFVSGNTSCSLETAAAYLDCPNVFWMNSLHSLESLNDTQWGHLSTFDSLVCGLTHIEHGGDGSGDWELFYRESAEKIARMSLRHPNIKGAIIDDFRCPEGPSKDLSDEELHAINGILKEINPALKLYLVHYHVSRTPEMLESCAADFDGLTLWAWHSTDHFWKALYEDEIRKLRRMYPGKELIQGQFIHAYGDAGGAQPMDQMELQCESIAYQMDRGRLDGWCALQNGWFCRQDHRKQVEYLRSYWEWYRNTRTCR